MENVLISYNQPQFRILLVHLLSLFTARMNRLIRQFYLLSATLVASLLAQAQQDTTTLENVDVYTNYKPNVAESVKIDLEPTLKDPEVSPPSYDYEFPNIAYKPKAVYSQIDPVYLKVEEPEPLADNYLELGGGNYLSSYLDASIHNTRDKYYTYGLRVKHHASSASKNPQQALFSQNRITAFGKREKGTNLSGEIDYQRNVVHYYGYLVDTPSLELGDINQIYNDINAGLEWEFDERNYDGNLDFDFNLFDKLGENESTIRLQNFNGFKAGRGTFNLDFSTVFTQLNERANLDRLFIDLTPHMEFKYNKFSFDLGLNGNYALQSDSVSTGQFRIFPHLKAETYLVPDKLRAYFGVTGGLNPNTLQSMSYDNLFLGNNLNYQSTATLFNLYVGMNGSFKRFVEYGIKLSSETLKDQYLFVNDTNQLRNFVLVYDDFNRFTFSGEIKFDVHQNVDLGFRGNFYAYSSGSNEADQWHLPDYDGALFTTFRIADKLYLDASYFATSSRRARDLSNNLVNLAAINDINVGAEYRYKQNISAFLKVNNLLNQNFELFNHYRAQGLNVLAGVTFSL